MTLRTTVLFFCAFFVIQSSVGAEEKLLCDTGKIFRFSANEDGGFDGSLGGKFTSTANGKEVTYWCHFEGIKLLDQFDEKRYASLYEDTLEGLMFFSGFYEHCSSGRVLVFNKKHGTVVEINTEGLPKPITHVCRSD